MKAELSGDWLATFDMEGRNPSPLPFLLWLGPSFSLENILEL